MKLFEVRCELESGHYLNDVVAGTDHEYAHNATKQKLKSVGVVPIDFRVIEVTLNETGEAEHFTS